MTTEYYNGSSCTGTNGTTGRVLTLSNASRTISDGFFVYLSGLVLTLTTNYTISHNSSGSIITFLDPVWNDQQIVVSYFTSAIGASATGNDFEDGPLADLGVTVSRTPVTESDSNIGGQKTYTDGSAADVTAVIKNITKGYFVDEAGEEVRADALLFIRASQTMNKHDKITYNTQTYKVHAVSPRIFQGTTQFKTAILFLVT